MPAVCVKTSAPTIGALSLTFFPLKASTSFDTATSRDSSTRVRHSVWSWSAATTSASLLLPARSPIPLTLVWMPRAPAATAARQLAVASP